MRLVLAAVTVAVILLVVGGLGFIYSGLFDVAATDPHWPVTRWALEQTKARSISARAADVVVPEALDDPEKVQAGVDHFAAHCAICHGAPGVPKGEIAKGMYPEPPSLTDTAQRYGAAELFWIVKHGIKMTGMPAWDTHSDEALWATVAFLRALPSMSEQDYARLLVRSMGGGGHGHGSNQDGAAGEGHTHSPPDTKSEGSR